MVVVVAAGVAVVAVAVVAGVVVVAVVAAVASLPPTLLLWAVAVTGKRVDFHTLHDLVSSCVAGRLLSPVFCFSSVPRVIRYGRRYFLM